VACGTCAHLQRCPETGPETPDPAGLEELGRTFRRSCERPVPCSGGRLVAVQTTGPYIAGGGKGPRPVGVRITGPLERIGGRGGVRRTDTYMGAGGHVGGVGKGGGTTPMTFRVFWYHKVPGLHLANRIFAGGWASLGPGATTFRSIKRTLARLAFGTLTRNMAITISEAEYHHHNNNHDGLCLSCKEWTFGGCEPDAVDYPCDGCGASKVVGCELALVMMELDID